MYIDPEADSNFLHFSNSERSQSLIYSGGGMPMGYGGYSSQPMDQHSAYGGASYGSMGMMGANAFQGGMPMG